MNSKKKDHNNDVTKLDPVDLRKHLLEVLSRSVDLEKYVWQEGVGFKRRKKKPIIEVIFETSFKFQIEILHRLTVMYGGSKVVAIEWLWFSLVLKFRRCNH